MTSLKSEPAGNVRTMSEFFALARSMEADAAARYTDTARQLRQQGAGPLADLFDGLAETEMGHVRQVEEWAQHRGETLHCEAPWPIPDTYDAPPGEVAGSKLLTPYRALAAAVRHEERSFAFWSYIAAHADKAEVKDAAERMALEELEHVSLLRRERRKAFHAERFGGSVSPQRPISLGSLATMERRLADLIEQNTDCSASGREFAMSLAASARTAASKLDDLDAVDNPPRLMAPNLPAELAQDVGAIAEYLAEAYLRLAEAAPDGSVLSAAQDLAKAAIYRLGTLEYAPDQMTDGTA